jgi:hypothetical protein
LESGTAEMSADSVVLDSDVGLFSDGSVSVDSVFDELGLYSEGEVDVEAVDICREVADIDVAEEASEEEPEVELPKNIICKKGKGNIQQKLLSSSLLHILFSGKCQHIINSITRKHFQKKAFEKYKSEVNGKLPSGFEHIM